MGVLKARDPATGLWLDVASVGSRGPAGPPGPTGPTGPTNTAITAEVLLGPNPPGPELLDTDIWYDTATVTQIGQPAWPPGGANDQVIVKASNADNDLTWAGPHLPLSGGTITGNLTVASDFTTPELTAPTVAGNIDFDSGISADDVEDRTSLPWEYWDAVGNFAGGWESWGDGSGEHGPCVVARNKFMVVVSLCFRRTGTRDDDSWQYLFASGLPVGWRPKYALWDNRQSVEDWEAGTIFETRLEPDGQVYVRSKKWSLTWNEWSAIPVSFTYPRWG